jgi:hypothetical protein
MSDADLARKFHGLVDPILGSVRGDELWSHAMNVASLGSLQSLITLAVPSEARPRDVLPAITAYRCRVSPSRTPWTVAYC